MEKLIELLNQFEKARIKKVNAKWLPYNIKLSFRPYTEEYLTNKAYKSSQLEVCSKYYGFIKHLVDNDKIDLLKLTCMNPRYTEIIDSDFFWDDIIIMILSIQDNSIEFLISILK